MNNFSFITAQLALHHDFMLQSKKILSMAFILCVITLLSACQLTEKKSSNVQPHFLRYSQYYLWLKTLTNEQVIAEEAEQKSLMASQSQENSSNELLAQSKLILIYSLANTPLHQPYKSKRLLNDYLLTDDVKNNENLAFSMFLREHLNTQLKLHEKLEAQKKEFNKRDDDYHALIKQLQQQLDQVNQQLILLKRIDQNINERG